MLERDHVSSWFYIVDLEPTIRISRGRVLAVGLAVACTELHIGLSNRLPSRRQEDRALYGYAGSDFWNGILKCERTRYKARKSHNEAFHRETSLQLTDGRACRTCQIYLYIKRAGDNGKDMRRSARFPSALRVAQGKATA
jgi:hypothetical protein